MQASDSGVCALNLSAILPSEWRHLQRGGFTFNPLVVFILQILFKTDRAKTAHVVRTPDPHDLSHKINQ